MNYTHLFRRVRKEWVIVGLVIVVLLLAGTAMLASLARPGVTVRLGDGVFMARTAQTQAERERGLSGTTGLDAGQAMLFVFDHDDTWGIWMKDMNYSIDVVWLNAQKQVVYSVSNMTPDTYPTVFRPTKAARYVIELPAGTIRHKAIGAATVAQFTLPRTDN